MKKLYSQYFDDEGHLTTLARALYADAMKLNQVIRLPQPLQSHVNQCAYCSSLIAVLYDAIEEIDYQDAPTHPILKAAPNSKLSIGDKPEDIEALLQQVMQSAIEVPSMERLIKMQTQDRYRKAGNAKFTLNEPFSNQLYFNQVDFRFVAPTSISIALSIRSHKGRVFKAELPTQTALYTVTFTPKEKFPSGLYYWKLSPKGGKPFVGKFYIYQT